MWSRAFALLLLAGLSCRAHAATYEVTDLGALGGSLSDAYGINENGQVVGRAATTGNAAYEPTLFKTGGNLDLGNFGGELNQANGINNLGVVVGSNTLPGNTNSRGFVYFAGTLVKLETLGGADSKACAINDAGQITGSSTTGSGQHAFRYQNGTMTDLGGTSATGFAINSSGVVVGESNVKAFIATANTIVSIGTLGTGSLSAAYGINDSNQVVGKSTDKAAGLYHPFLYENGVMKDIGMLGSGDQRAAFAINNSAHIVGESNLAAGGTEYHAFLYISPRRYDLNDLIPADSGWVLTRARAINSKGEIVGSGTYNGATRAFLLTPVDPSGQSPQISVKGPKHITTSKARLKLHGTSSGSVGKVLYRIGSQGKWRPTHGPVSGWNVAIKLKPGKNTVQFVAESSTGEKSKTAKVVVVRKDA